MKRKKKDTRKLTLILKTIKLTTKSEEKVEQRIYMKINLINYKKKIKQKWTEVNKERVEDKGK